jgi:hypothetical protein
VPESFAHALERWTPGTRRTPGERRGAQWRARSVARTLERLAAAAEDGARRPRRYRPPRSVLEVSLLAEGIRELAALLRERPDTPLPVVRACDRFADGCWNGALRRLDREYHRRELGRLRYLLLSA